MSNDFDDATVALVAQQIWAGFIYKQRQGEAGRARAASLTPERRQEIARAASAAAQAKRVEQRKRLLPA